MELSDLANLIKSRRSIRRWQDKEVPAELLLQAIEFATWAPNGSNMQNWRFYLILKRETIQAIANAVQDKANYVASLPEAEELGISDGIRERAGSFRSAPAAIAVAAASLQTAADRILTKRKKADVIAREMCEGREVANPRIQSVASAVAYLLLVLHQMGLGAVWMVSPMQAKGAIERILDVPPQLDLIAFIPVGYPAESPVSKGRKAVREVCEVIR